MLTVYVRLIQPYKIKKIAFKVKGQTSFSAIDWSAGPYFVEVYVNGTSMGTSMLVSVPY